jgi:hypothetical protein
LITITLLSSLAFLQWYARLQRDSPVEHRHYDSNRSVNRRRETTDRSVG